MILPLTARNDEGADGLSGLKVEMLLLPPFRD